MGATRRTCSSFLWTRGTVTKYLHIKSTEQYLASSKLQYPANVSSPPHQRRGGTHSPGGEGLGGQYFGNARHSIGLLQYNTSTGYGKEATKYLFKQV